MVCGEDWARVAATRIKRAQGATDEYSLILQYVVCNASSVLYGYCHEKVIIMNKITAMMKEVNG